MENVSGSTHPSTENCSAVKTKQATALQFIAVVFILGLATKMFLQPIYLIRSAGRDAYIALAIDGGVELVTLALTLVAMRLSPDTDFFALIKSVFGKIGSRIVIGVIGLFMLFKLNVSTAEILTFYDDSVFADFDAHVMIIVLLVFLAAVGLHTLRALSRLNEILTPVILICLVVLITISLVTGFDFANILPVMRAPAEFKSALVSYSTWLGDFAPLALFIGRTKIKKRGLVGAGIAGGVASAIAVFFCVALCAAFGNVRYLADSGTNLSSILQYSIGNVYGRVDLFSTVLWSLSAFIEVALFFYCAVRCIEFCVGKNAHFITSLVLCFATFFLQFFVMSDPTLFSLVTTSLATNIVSFSFSLIIPTLALICAFVQRKRSATCENGVSA